MAFTLYFKVFQGLAIGVEIVGRGILTAISQLDSAISQLDFVCTEDAREA
jgi:hypothetical protein